LLSNIGTPFFKKKKRKLIDYSILLNGYSRCQEMLFFWPDSFGYGKRKPPIGGRRLQKMASKKIYFGKPNF